MNPLNPAPAVEPVDGVVAIPDRETFEALSYQGRRVVIDKHLRDLEFVKFYLFVMDTDRPVVYFMNTETHRAHSWFGYVIDLWHNLLWLQGAMRGEIVYHPNVVAPDGSLGVYRFEFEPQDAYSFEVVAYAYEVLAASMRCSTTTSRTTRCRRELCRCITRNGRSSTIPESMCCWRRISSPTWTSSP